MANGYKKIFKSKSFRLKMLKFLRFVPDKLMLKLEYRIKFEKKLRLKEPKTYNEKIQWLKLYDRKPIYTTMVDKHAAKEYISEKIGENYVIPTLGVWDRFEDIDFDALPEQFVLKCNHDSGSVLICKDKSSFDFEKAKQVLTEGLKQNGYYCGREWPYKNVKPCILAEAYLSALDNEELVEYKIFCFDGEAKIVLVCKGQAHGVGRTNDFMDRDFNRIPVMSLNPHSSPDPARPEQLDEIITIAEKLSADIPQLRVDTYIANGKVYVGELTFFHNSGMSKFEPEEWDYTFGSWIKLPKEGK